MSVWHLRNVTIELIIAAEGSVHWVTAPLWRLIWGDSDWSSKVWAVIRSNQTCFFFSSTAKIACAWMYEYNVSLDKLRLQLRLWGISVPDKTSNYILISTTWRWSYKRLLLLFIYYCLNPCVSRMCEGLIQWFSQRESSSLLFKFIIYFSKTLGQLVLQMGA